MRSFKAKFVVIAGLALVAGVVAISVLSAHLERSHAERFLAALNEVRVGTTNKSALLEATAAFRGHRREHSDSGAQQIEFLFNNAGLYWLRLAPYTEFRAYVTMKDSIVVEKYAVEAVPSIGCNASVDETVRGFGFVDGVAPAEHPNHMILGGGQAPSKRIIVRDDSTYGDAERRQDWDFNLACLARFGGCGDSRLLLPHAVPTQTRSGNSGNAP